MTTTTSTLRPGSWLELIDALYGESWNDAIGRLMRFAASRVVETNRSLPRRLQRILNADGSDTVTVDLLNAFGSLAAFDRLARTPLVAFLEPPSIDPRIVNRFALFSLMSSPAATMDDWLSAHATLGRRVIVPAQLKWEIRDKLDQANVNERVLFPGLDGRSQWLTRYYWRKPQTADRTVRTEDRPRFTRQR